MYRPYTACGTKENSFILSTLTMQNSETPVILLIDDQIMMAESLAQRLKPQFEIILAHNMNEMQSQCRQYQFHLALLDMQMNDGNPSTSYMNFLRRNNIPTLILANAITDVELFLCYKLGARGEIAKQVATNELVLIIQRVLNGHQAYSGALLERIRAFEAFMPPLAQRYRKVVEYFLADDYLSTKEIADKEALELGTAKNYISDTVKTFAAIPNRRQLTNVLRKMGFTPSLVEEVYTYLHARHDA